MTGLNLKPTPQVKYIVAAVFRDGLTGIPMYLDMRGEDIPPHLNIADYRLASRMSWEPTQDQATRVESFEAAALWARFIYLRTECTGVHILEAE